MHPCLCLLRIGRWHQWAICSDDAWGRTADQPPLLRCFAWHNRPFSTCAYSTGRTAIHDDAKRNLLATAELVVNVNVGASVGARATTGRGKTTSPSGGEEIEDGWHPAVWGQRRYATQTTWERNTRPRGVLLLHTSSEFWADYSGLSIHPSMFISYRNHSIVKISNA